MRSEGDFVVRRGERFTFVAERGGNWAAVEGIRLPDGAAADAVAEVRAMLAETDTRIASWWLSERTAPVDAEAQLLAAGLELLADDYLVDAMLTTSAPPAAPKGVVARAVATADELVAVHELEYEAFETLPERRRSREQIVALRSPTVLYGAWIDEELVAAARATYASCGALLSGGVTLPHARGRGAYRALVRARWDDAVARGTPVLTVGAGPMSGPILRRLGFEKVLQFRRIQSTRDDAG